MDGSTLAGVLTAGLLIYCCLSAWWHECCHHRDTFTRGFPCLNSDTSSTTLYPLPW